MHYPQNVTCCEKLLLQEIKAGAKPYGDHVEIERKQQCSHRAVSARKWYGARVAFVRKPRGDGTVTAIVV